jgi:hypothetical protein
MILLGVVVAMGILRPWVDLGQVNSRIPFAGVAAGIPEIPVFKAWISNEAVLTRFRRQIALHEILRNPLERR